MLADVEGQAYFFCSSVSHSHPNEKVIKDMGIHSDHTVTFLEPPNFKYFILFSAPIFALESLLHAFGEPADLSGAGCLVTGLGLPLLLLSCLPSFLTSLLAF